MISASTIRLLPFDLFADIILIPETSLSRRDFPDEVPDYECYRAVAVEPALELTLPPEPPHCLSEEECDAYRWKLEELTAGPTPPHARPSRSPAERSARER